MPYPCWWMHVIQHHWYNRRCKTQNRLSSVFAHFRDRACSISLAFVAIYAANTLLMTVFDLSHPQITEDTQPTIIDAPLTLIFRIWLGACVYSFWSLRQPLHQKWTVRYQCQYFKINTSISECDHQCETQHAEPQMGNDGSSQTQGNPRADRYGSRFALPRVHGSGFCTGLEPNRQVSAVHLRTARGRPGPIANTTYGDTICLHIIYYRGNLWYRLPTPSASFAVRNTHWQWMQFRSCCHRKIKLV